jgi:hypothetical protein
MKRHTWTATALAVALGCVVATAQTPSTQSAAKSGDTITVVGCLADNTAAGGATGTSGTTTPSAAAGKFVLNNATMGSASGSGTAGTTGAGSPTSAAGGSMGKSYILDGTESDLKDHVGQKVEITGTLADSSRSGASATPSAPAGSGSMASAAHLRVSSVKMIASSCDAK